MPLHIIRNDITKVECDAIVNASNHALNGSGGVDAAIHRAAGSGLDKECEMLGGCEVGQAKLTGAYNLPAKYVIHTVGPRWRGGLFNEAKALYRCHTACLDLAKKYNCESIAFPLIASGVYGYPKALALRTAVSAISEFLCRHEMTVYLVVYDPDSYSIGKKLFSDIRSYIDDRYIDLHTMSSKAMNRTVERSRDFAVKRSDACEGCAPILCDDMVIPAPASPSLEDMIAARDESFSQMLLRKIDEKGMTDAQCYKKANVDRKLFSKIRNDINYHPKKSTAIAFAIALELDIDETKDLISRAGFALSRSSKFDIIIEYFIHNRNYNVFEINEALFAFDQSLLGV